MHMNTYQLRTALQRGVAHVGLSFAVCENEVQ